MFGLRSEKLSQGGELQEGLSGEAHAAVQKRDLASAYGNEGVEVLSSMTLMTLLEQACINALEGRLRPDQMCVGSRMEMDHLAPTPEGFTVTAKASLTEVDKSKLVFSVEAFDQGGRVASAVHTRHVVNRDRFLDMVAQKAAQGVK